MVMRSFLTVKVKQTERNEKRKGENEFIILLNATKIDFKDKCYPSFVIHTITLHINVRNSQWTDWFHDERTIYIYL